MNSKILQISMVLSCFLVLTSGLGCATSFGAYMKDRGNDFADCFKADVGVGIGADTHVMVTDFVVTGAGAGYTKKVGFRGRHTGSWKEAHLGLPASTCYALVSIITYREEGSFSVVHIPPWWLLFITDMNEFGPKEARVNTASCLFVPVAIESNPGQRDKKLLIDKFGLECGVTVGVAGARVGFSPGQLLDFVLGWFGVDLAKDDTKKQKKHDTKKKKKASTYRPYYGKMVYILPVDAHYLAVRWLLSYR